MGTGRRIPVPFPLKADRRGPGKPRWGGWLAGLLLVALVAAWAGAGFAGPWRGTGRAPGRWVFRDDLGQRVLLPAPPRRVACSGRDLCDLVQALLGDAAVTVLPPGAEEQALRPGLADLVLLPEVTRRPGLAGRLRARGWPAATLRWRDVTQLPDATLRLAAWLNRVDRGRELAATYARRLAGVEAAVAAIPPAQRPPVLVLAWDRPPVWAGAGSPAAILVERAGGRLVTGGAAENAARWPAGPAGRLAGGRARWGAGDAAGAGPAGGDGGRGAARPSGGHARPGAVWLAGSLGGRAAAWLAGEEAWRAASWPAGTRVVTSLLTPAVPPGGPEAATALYLPPAQLLGAGPEALQGLERLAAWLHPGRTGDAGEPLRMVPLPVAP